MTLRIYPLRFHSAVGCRSPALLTARTCNWCFPGAGAFQPRRQRRKEYLPKSRSNCAGSHVLPPFSETSTLWMPLPPSNAIPSISNAPLDAHAFARLRSNEKRANAHSIDRHSLGRQMIRRFVGCRRRGIRYALLIQKPSNLCGRTWMSFSALTQ